MNTKIVSMTTMIDDVYDIYGLLEELELLTDFIDMFLFIFYSYIKNMQGHMIHTYRSLITA